jgi:alkyl hydroperoxide reductase subunit F
MTMKRDAFLVAKDLGGQAVDSTKIENSMGYDFITGPQLIEKFQSRLPAPTWLRGLFRRIS